MPTKFYLVRASYSKKKNESRNTHTQTIATTTTAVYEKEPEGDQNSINRNAIDFYSAI